MNIKGKILEMVNSEYSVQYAYMAIEKLITVMMSDYLAHQGKQFEWVSMNRDVAYDAWLPDGIDDIPGSVALEIKMYRNGRVLASRLHEIIKMVASRSENIDALILVIVNDIPAAVMKQLQDRSNQFNFKVYIWDVNKLVEIFETNENLFIETYTNLSKALFQDTINSGISRDNETYLLDKKKHIQTLISEYKNDNIVLFLGAGASKDADIATWDELISELFVTLIDEQLRAKNIDIEFADQQKIAAEIVKQNGDSPLLQTRFLRNGFTDRFEAHIGNILYKNAKDTSDLLEEICYLCVPDRGKLGIRAIINYNFDDLVEKNLKRLRVKHHSIYGEGITPDNEELGIYHVHGFIPQNKDGYNNLAQSLLVFSEEGYHKLMLEPYHWANMIQLNFMMNNTCIFVGLSMTDPNMRRLLEIATQKNTEGNSICKHYAIMRRFHIQDSDKNNALKRFEGVNESLQESFFKELGINIIWVDEYSEIPNLLRQIKEG